MAFQETQLIEAISWTSPYGDEGVVMVTDPFLNQDAAGIRGGNVQHHFVYEIVLISRPFPFDMIQRDLVYQKLQMCLDNDSVPTN